MKYIFLFASFYISIGAFSQNNFIFSHYQDCEIADSSNVDSLICSEKQEIQRVYKSDPIDFKAEMRINDDETSLRLFNLLGRDDEFYFIDGTNHDSEKRVYKVADYKLKYRITINRETLVVTIQREGNNYIKLLYTSEAK